ncbi:hypothetical protein [Nitratireductor basaltis]|uniref:Uncharacterized protein n=1 Tax=Nitratireductor basaltis TaxID=472175 RepID=A0A084U7B2_9HYPH|nr:hypothetical protein [Nitratireductor basaltis]KFB08848.1 hypothetical protein EL18_03102 [Nitratireductor basaltis]
MLNNLVRTAGEAMPAGENLSRRSVLAGAASTAILAVPRMAAATPLTQNEIALHVHDLAAEMSMLLAKLDGGNWQTLVSAARYDIPIYTVQPRHVPPRVRIEQALAVARSALNDLQPGHWRSTIEVEMGFVWLTNDECYDASTLRKNLSFA